MRFNIFIFFKTPIKAIISTGVLHNICEDSDIPVTEGDFDQDEDNDDINDACDNHHAEEGETCRARLIRERLN